MSQNTQTTTPSEKARAFIAGYTVAAQQFCDVLNLREVEARALNAAGSLGWLEEESTHPAGGAGEAVGYVTQDGSVTFYTEGSFSSKPKAGTELFTGPASDGSNYRGLVAQLYAVLVEYPDGATPEKQVETALWALRAFYEANPDDEPTHPAPKQEGGEIDYKTAKFISEHWHEYQDGPTPGAAVVVGDGMVARFREAMRDSHGFFNSLAPAYVRRALEAALASPPSADRWSPDSHYPIPLDAVEDAKAYIANWCPDYVKAYIDSIASPPAAGDGCESFTTWGNGAFCVNCGRIRADHATLTAAATDGGA